MDLNRLVVESFAKIQGEGFVEKVVEEKLKKTVESIIEDLLRSYSDFGKALQAEVKSQLNVNLKELDLSGYNQMVLNVVKQKLDEATHVLGVEKIKESLDSLLGDVKQEYKLSEIIEQMKAIALEWDSDHHGDEITFVVDNRHSLIFISFDEDSGKREYDCKYRLSVDKDGVVTSVNIEGKKFDNKVIMGGLHGVEETLFKIFTHGAKLIVDDGDVEVEYGYGDDNY